MPFFIIFDINGSSSLLICFVHNRFLKILAVFITQCLITSFSTIRVQLVQEFLALSHPAEYCNEALVQKRLVNTFFVSFVGMGVKLPSWSLKLLGTLLFCFTWLVGAYFNKRALEPEGDGQVDIRRLSCMYEQGFYW